MDWQNLRRDSGLVMIIATILFIGLAFFVFWLGFKLIFMGVTGEFKILAEFKGFWLYIFSLSPGIILAGIMACVLICGLPKVLHPKN